MKSRLYKGIENKFLMTVVGVLVLVFSVFFSSKLWMYDDNPILQTQFNVSVSGLDQTKVMLKNWEYNPDGNLMEVTLELEHDGTDVVKPTYTFIAKDRESMNELVTKVVYQDEQNIVVQINEVPEKYKVIGLFVKEIRDEGILIKEAKERMTDEEIELIDGNDKVKLTLSKPREAVVTGDYRRVKVNNELGEQSELVYQINNLDLEIVNLVKEINKILTEVIPENNEVISSINREIEKIKEGMEYETEDEKSNSENSILSKEESISRVQNENEELQKEVKTLKEKQANLERKKENILKENESVDEKEESSKSE